MERPDTVELALAQIEAALEEQNRALEAAFERALSWPDAELAVDASALEELAEATKPRVELPKTNKSSHAVRC